MADLGILQTYESTFDYSKSLGNSFEMKEFDFGLSTSLESQPAEHTNFEPHVAIYDPRSQIKTGPGELHLKTKVQNVITGGVYCALYYRESKELVDVKVSDQDGNVTFSNLTLDIGAYYFVSLTDTEFKSLVFDNLSAN